MRYISRALGLATALPFMLIGFAANADSPIGNSGGPPSPMPLPVANITVPSLNPLNLESGGTFQVLDQIKLLETPGGMAVMYILSPRNAADDPAPWSMIATVRVRMFNIDIQAHPEAADYLIKTHALTDKAYALDIPPKAAGDKPTVILWENQRDGVLTQDKLEKIYQVAHISRDPITAPNLNELSWNNLLINAANHVLNAPTRIIILAFHSANDPDVVLTTKLRILTGVETIKSTTTPVAELDEDAHPDITSRLVPASNYNGPLLIVFNAVTRKIEGIVDPTQLPSLTEDAFQKFAMEHGVPSFLNTRTDVAEAFLKVVRDLNTQQTSSGQQH